MKSRSALIQPTRTLVLGAFFLSLLTAALAKAQENRPRQAGAKPAAGASDRDPAIVFEDLTRQAGIDFVHRSAPEKKYILESMSGGVAALDFDSDGWLDLYLVNSLTVRTADRPETAPSALYRNRGDGTFENVSAKARVDQVGWGVGVCVADVDADGHRDLYVTAVGRNRLYRNLGDGTFEEVAEKLGIAASGWSAGCGFADYDRDGDLDLFVSRYLEMDLENLPVFGEGKTCQYRGIAVQCGPRGLPGTSDLLFRNDGGRFTEVGEKAGVRDPEGFFGLGIAWLDVDRDGWIDLYVANDSGPNFLYRNLADGTFEEIAFPMGVAVSEDGGEQGVMGVAVGDYQNLGRFALLVTNFSEEYNALYADQGEYFTDVSFRSASAPSSLRYVGWGTAFFDPDNDGWLDLMVVNGHVYPQLDQAKLAASAKYRQPKLFYRNRGDGTFADLSSEVGAALAEEKVSRGLAVGDFDNDGRLDVVINDLDGAPQLLMNRTRDAGHWLSVELQGQGGNLDAIGAVVTVKAGKTRQSRLVQSGSSYLSQSDFRLHFGLGKETSVGEVEVVWPDATRSTQAVAGVDRVIRVVQGSGASTSGASNGAN
ncbi:MAG: CRTAC1 family protein [Acidobacteriota bacterium]